MSKADGEGNRGLVGAGVVRGLVGAGVVSTPPPLLYEQDYSVNRVWG